MVAKMKNQNLTGRSLNKKDSSQNIKEKKKKDRDGK